MKQDYNNLHELHVNLTVSLHNFLQRLTEIENNIDNPKCSLRGMSIRLQVIKNLEVRLKKLIKKKGIKYDELGKINTIIEMCSVRYRLMVDYKKKHYKLGKK